MDCFGDQITNKNTKTYTKWLEVIGKVLNMLIGLKGDNYYSKVFKRVNYKLSNSPFWVVISLHAINDKSQTQKLFKIRFNKLLSQFNIIRYYSGVDSL